MKHALPWNSISGEGSFRQERLRAKMGAQSQRDRKANPAENMVTEIWGLEQRKPEDQLGKCSRIKEAQACFNGDSDGHRFLVTRVRPFLVT
jgi:hypothetical protein